MPIHIGKRKFEHFKAAVKYIRRTKKNIKNPKGYVAAIERKQRGKTK